MARNIESGPVFFIITGTMTGKIGDSHHCQPTGSDQPQQFFDLLLVIRQMFQYMPKGNDLKKMAFKFCGVSF